MTGTETDLTNGIALLIQTAGLATYNTSGVYPAGQTGIFIKATNPTPDRIVILTAYQVNDDPSQPLSLYGLQVRCRGTSDSRDVDDLADSIFRILHGLVHVDFGSVHANQILRKSALTLGQDDSKRWERADAYYIDLNTPPTALRPAGGSW